MVQFARYVKRVYPETMSFLCMAEVDQGKTQELRRLPALLAKDPPLNNPRTSKEDLDLVKGSLSPLVSGPFPTAFWQQRLEVMDYREWVVQGLLILNKTVKMVPPLPRTGRRSFYLKSSLGLRSCLYFGFCLLELKRLDVTCMNAGRVWFCFNLKIFDIN